MSSSAITRHGAHRGISRGCFKAAIGRRGCTSGQRSLTPKATRREMLVLLPASTVALTTISNRPALADGPSSDDAAQALSAAMRKVIKKDKAPVLLRLAFHDAGTYRLVDGTGGPNASIQYELERPESFGLKRGWRVIQEVEGALKGTAAEGLSDADVIAAAGAYVVGFCGGPVIQVPLGRQQASDADPNGRMLTEKASSQEQKAYFESMGLSLQEAIALLGAHTLGNKGYGDPYTFDNTYFVELLKKPWTNTKDAMASMIGIPSDHVLPDDDELVPYIEQYAFDQGLFFKDFSAAYIKMTSLGTNLG